jgi:hypothetical protein
VTRFTCDDDCGRTHRTLASAQRHADARGSMPVPLPTRPASDSPRGVDLRQHAPRHPPTDAVVSAALHRLAYADEDARRWAVARGEVSP